MKRILSICLLLILIIPTVAFSAVTGPARVRMLDGDIMFRTTDGDEWLPAAINTPLDEGDVLWCPDNAKAEVQLADGSIVRIDQGSQLDFLANEDGFTHLHLASGRAYVKTSLTMANNALQIDADDTTVLPEARTRLRIDILPNNQEDVSIFKGSAYVEGNGSRTNVRAGEHIALEEGHNALLPLNPPDRWETWNIDRDRELSRSTKADSNLPEELRSYSAELDSNGRWLNVPEYGMVWQPTVFISNDWAPYRSGRWIWKGDDYIWLSSESWGWVPYHYGRWAVVGSFGWCWVPPVRGEVFWGPGYVGWYRTGSHIGWTPLAPGEIFYGRRNYGRHSVNINTSNVNTRNIIYRNRRVRGGMTILPQNDFLRGRVVSQPPSRNSSLSVSVSVGSPRIQPLRESRMPIVKQTPPKVIAPRIERRDTRELRQRFPRVTPEAATLRRYQQSVAAPAVSQPQTVPAQRDEHRQRSTTPPTAPQTSPPLSGTVPHRPEQTQQPAQATDQPSTSVAQSRREHRQNTVSTQQENKPAPGVTPQRIEKSRQVKESREKRIWRVASPEEGKVQPQREIVPRERERREREIR